MPKAVPTWPSIVLLMVTDKIIETELVESTYSTLHFEICSQRLPNLIISTLMHDINLLTSFDSQV